MEDFITFLHNIAYTGTNEWVSNFITNNYYIIAPPFLALCAWLKGKYPDFWAKLSTAIPFIGNPGSRL